MKSRGGESLQVGVNNGRKRATRRLDDDGGSPREVWLDDWELAEMLFGPGMGCSVELELPRISWLLPDAEIY